MRRMSAQLAKHLQRMLKAFADAAAKAHPSPGVARIAFMWLCARKAFDRAKEDDERTFWRRYLEMIDRSAQRAKDEIESRRS